MSSPNVTSLSWYDRWPKKKAVKVNNCMATLSHDVTYMPTQLQKCKVT